MEFSNMPRPSAIGYAMACFGLWAASLVPASAQDPGFRVPKMVRTVPATQLAPVSPAEALKKMKALDDAYHLSVGDLISIRVFEDRREPIHVRISPSGEAFTPYLGLLTAAGVTAKELAFRLKARLEAEKFFPEAHVMVSLDKLAADAPSDAPSGAGNCTVEFVVVFGAVAKTGKYDYPPFEDLTVSDLIDRAGGLTTDKKYPKIWISRRTRNPEGKKRILVNTEAALSEKHGEYDLYLRIDDIVIVER